ncbi:MAG TPA: hypothetical protein VHV50_10625, partial [Actinomycetota bacterium]|nr:hypothetical protein [Actinomycetota bacterium]
MEYLGFRPKKPAKKKTPPNAGAKKKHVPGVKIGVYLAGFAALDVFKKYAFWPVQDMYRHMVIIGETGAGKTSTAWAVLDGLAKVLTRKARRGEGLSPQFFLIDANADRGFARLFAATMLANGLGKLAIFPEQRINAWPNDWRATYNRLLELIPLAEDRSGASYFADASAIALELACRLPGKGPPKSTKDLLGRLNYDLLVSAYEEEELDGVTRELVESMRMRCRRVCGEIGTAFDGKRDLNDLDAAYFGVDAMVMGHSTVVATRMLISHLAFYLRYEKHPDRPCTILIDEFASLGGEVDIGTLIEQARKLNVSVILLSQTVAGLGGPTQVKRILHNAGVVIAHRTPEWRELESVIGIESVPEMTWRYGEEGETEGEQVKTVKKAIVDRGELLALPLGHVWVFKGNEAMLVEVELPSMRHYREFVLPEGEELFELFAQPVGNRPIDPPQDVEAPREPDEIMKRRWDHARATEEGEEAPEFSFLVKELRGETPSAEG